MPGRSDPLRVDFKGPFFEGDPKKKVVQNIADLMVALAAEAERDVVGQMVTSTGTRKRISNNVIPPRVFAHVIGRPAKRPYTAAVVSVRNQGLSQKQGIALMAAASRVEGQTHAFRRTAGRIRRARSIIRANLAKGLD